MLTEAQVRLALRDCYTAANPFGRALNIVDLGLIETLTLTLDQDAPGAGIAGVPPRFRLELHLLACTADEVAREQLGAVIGNRLAGMEQLSTRRIVFEETPAWTPARVSPELRRALSLDSKGEPIPPMFPILK